MRILFIILLLFIAHPSFSQKAEKIQVFTSGTEGHKTYRIPAIVQLPNGNLVAFCEGRVHGSGDFGDINIVMKRSTDHGATWSTLQTVVDYASLQAGNPAPVVDLRDPDYPKGRIFLFYNTGNHHENEVRKGAGLREVWYKTSTDGGFTWSEPVNITRQTHRPKQPAINPEYTFAEDWRSYANTPGHAMQISSGKYKGRIFVAANHSAGDPQPHFTDYSAHGFYTDDHGKSFQLSETIAIPGSNEAMAAELPGGRLMMNIRNQRGDIRARIIAISNDGGRQWDTAYFDKNLPDPVCQGSLLSLGKKKNMLAFCNPADTVYRDNLTLRISNDEGKTWMKTEVIEKSRSGKDKDPAAYSDLVEINQDTVGILYECKNYSEIVFVKYKWR